MSATPGGGDSGAPSSDDENGPWKQAAGRPRLSTNRRVVSETDEKQTRPDRVCVSLTALMTEEVGGAVPSREPAELVSRVAR